MATKSFSKFPTFRKRIALELFRLIKRNESKTHKLHTLFWECTLRCNVACRHCGSDCRVSSQQKDMPREDFLRVIDEILPHVDPHRLLVIFTGGEALLRDDLALCGQELNRREFPWGVVSNGYLMTASRLQELVAAGMHTATISLDGFEQAHNWLRRNPRSFERALNAIRLLGRYPEVTWDVVTCVNQHNIGDLNLFKEFLIENGVGDPCGPTTRQRPIYPSARIHPGMPKRGTDPHELWLRGIFGQLRIRGTRPVLPMSCRYSCRLGTGRRRHLGLPQHPGQLSSGKHL